MIVTTRLATFTLLPHRYEKKLMRYLEDLIREMDRKIAKSKDRAEKENAPKPIKVEDQAKLDELRQRAKGVAGRAGWDIRIAGC